LIFDELEKKLINNQKQFEREINSTLNNFDNKLTNRLSKVTREFKNNLRKNIYVEIDKEIDNAQFEKKFKEKSNIEVKNLEKALEKSINELAEKLSKQISQISNKYNQRSDEIIGIYFKEQIDNFHFDFDISLDPIADENLNNFIKSLVPTIFGIAITLINPVSWPILVVSLIGSFLSLGKKIYGHLNTNYRISEQKNMTDKYLNEL